MTSPNGRGAGESGALNVWSGTIPKNIPWRESYFIRDSDGAYMDGLDDLTIEIFLRDCITSAPVLSLSTADGTIIVEDYTDDDGNTVQIFRPDDASVTALEGDYFGDIVMTDASDVKTYWAAGVLTVTPNPASS